MKVLRVMGFGLLAVVSLVAANRFLATQGLLQEQNEILFQQLQRVHGLTDDQMTTIRKIFLKSGYIGQGNPAITQHPVTPEECQAKLKQLGVSYENPNSREFAKASIWRRCTTLRSKNPRTRRLVSMSSSSRTFLARTQWFG